MSESRETELIEAIIENLDDSETEYTKTPQSRNEEILVSILNETEYTKIPQSREEELLLELKEKIGGLVPPVPPVIKRVTGNPIAFSDGADAPLVKCVSEIQGSQDLHGYDKPWVGGARKNKYSGSSTHTVSRESVVTLESDLPSGVYYFSAIIDCNNPEETLSIVFRDASNNVLGTAYINHDSTSRTYRAVNVTAPIHSLIMRSGSTYATAQGYTATYTDIMLEYETYTGQYSPYSNICPITAYTEGEIEVGGRNLVPNTKYNGVSTSGGLFLAATNRITSYNGVAGQPVVGGFAFKKGTYTISIIGLENVTVVTNDGSGNIVDNFASAWNNLPFTFTLTQDAYLNWSAKKSNDADISPNNYNVQIERGDTLHDYEEYIAPTTHTTTFPSAIYRGSEDVVNGEVTSEWPCIDLGDLTWTYSSSGNHNFFWTNDLASVIKKPETANIVPNCICSIYTLVSPLYYNGHRTETHITVDETSGILKVHDARYSDATTFTNAMSGVQFAYELATPTTSSVTPTNLPIKSLSGYNHIESTTGEMQVDYITNQYQEFVNLTNAALPNTRKSGTKAMDIFLSLDNPKTPDQEEVDEIQNGVKEEIIDDR